MQNKHDKAYDDNDSEEMSEKDFKKYILDINKQAVAHFAQLHGDRWWKNCNDCNCLHANRYHPWAKKSPYFNPKTCPVSSSADFRMEGSKNIKRHQVSPPSTSISMRLFLSRT